MSGTVTVDAVGTVTVDGLDVSAYTVPTDKPEADGTFSWDATTLVVAEPRAGGCVGLGFTYTTSAAAVVIDELLRDVVLGADATAVPHTWRRMVAAIRNIGRPGVASAAIAALDIALWDLAAKLRGCALVDVLGAAGDRAPIYGSGGFTSYSDDELCAQLGRWVHDDRTPRVKMKIGRSRTVERVQAARAAIGDDAELYVDANGAFTAKQAVRLTGALRAAGVTWFEEPVSSDDLAGLRTVRELTDIDVAAGEYGSDLVYFERLGAVGAVDVLQADVTRCAGITEWVRVAACAAAHGLEISGHCAPALHLHPACAVPNLRHLEHFHDHVRIEHLLFDGVVDPVDGELVPDRSRPGLGLELKRADADRYRVR